MNKIMNYRNQIIVRKLGIDALTKELGAVGMAYFIRQFDSGSGNYTDERDELLDGITADEILESIREIEADIEGVKHEI